jgi:F0F1-type ATP synthase beta subunit
LEIDFDDDDDEDDDMDDDEVPPHNPASEQLPKLPIFHPAFELTEKTTKETLQIVEAYIKDSGYKDSEATHLLEEIKRRSRIPYGDAVRIGLIGDAGVGKSSTINSLLGIANLTVEVSFLILFPEVNTNRYRAMTGTLAHMLSSSSAKHHRRS